ncbi:MAG: response regulator [bacterium]
MINGQLVREKKSLKVLVVDDQSGMRETLSDILQEAGYAVDSANDGYVAIKKAGQQPFDIILMDIIMPGINGVEAIKEIKKVTSRPEFILMTAYSAETLINEAINCGIYRYITKPFPPDQIIALLEEIRNKKKKSRRNKG